MSKHLAVWIGKYKPILFAQRTRRPVLIDS